MGFFRKESDPADKQAIMSALEFAAEFHKNFEADPGRTLAWMAANAPDPLEAAARMLAILVGGNVISLEQLAVLGIDPEEFGQLVEKLRTENPRETLDHEAQVRAAIRDYDVQIDEIIKDAGISVDAEKRTEIRSALAKFAHENELTNLKIAYRLMKAEGSDPLKGLPGPTHPQGHL
jgi:hypothetical protein